MQIAALAVYAPLAACVCPRVGSRLDWAVRLLCLAIFLSFGHLPGPTAYPLLGLLWAWEGDPEAAARGARLFSVFLQLAAAVLFHFDPFSSVARRVCTIGLLGSASLFPFNFCERKVRADGGRVLWRFWFQSCLLFALVQHPPIAIDLRTVLVTAAAGIAAGALLCHGEFYLWNLVESLATATLSLFFAIAALPIPHSPFVPPAFFAAAVLMYHGAGMPWVTRLDLAGLRRRNLPRAIFLAIALAGVAAPFVSLVVHGPLPHLLGLLPPLPLALAAFALALPILTVGRWVLAPFRGREGTAGELCGAVRRPFALAAILPLAWVPLFFP